MSIELLLQLTSNVQYALVVLSNTHQIEIHLRPLTCLSPWFGRCCRPPTGKASTAGKKRSRKAAADDTAAAAADDDDFMQPRQQRSRRGSNGGCNGGSGGPSSGMLEDLMRVALDAGASQLVEMGYSRSKAVDALKECNCDVEMAIEYLTAACC